MEKFMMLLRSFAVWLVIIAAESIHGILRNTYLVPLAGDSLSRQIGVGTGSVIIFIISFFFIKWVGASSRKELLWIGLFWCLLTSGFEIILGRYVFGFSWERILSEYDLPNGGLMSLGMLFLIICPLVSRAARTRFLKENNNLTGSV